MITKAFLHIILLLMINCYYVHQKEHVVAALRCELTTNPLGIEAKSPRLSWVMNSLERGQNQSAYKVFVATTKEKLKQNFGDLWDSRKILSDQSAYVPYSWRELNSCLRYFGRFVPGTRITKYRTKANLHFRKWDVQQLLFEY